MATSRNTAPQSVSSFARIVLGIVIVLVFIAGIQLFILSEQTNHYFAWTIAPPLTAAFLGAGYWSALVSSIYSLRQTTWVEVRSSLPAAFTATTLLLIATLIHLDRFHLHSPVFITWLAAWVWVVVYVAVPPVLVVVFIMQSRLPGTNPPAQHALPAWMHAMLLVQALVAGFTGLALFLAPQMSMALWPWELTPLTARAVGTWLCAYGVAATIIRWENDIARVAGALAGLCAFAALQLIALLRYPNDVDWSNSGAWLYVLFLASVLLLTLISLRAHGDLQLTRDTRSRFLRPHP